MLVVGIEYTSRIVLENRDSKTYPLFINSEKPKGLILEGGTGNTNMLDPHLGYARDGTHKRLKYELPGFKVYGDGKGIRIMALGGSTTDPWDLNNWPKALKAHFDALGIKATVYNGGVSGYSTSQELLKLIRDARAINPNIVISLSAINDLGFKHARKQTPLVHSFQVRFLQSVLEDSPPKYMPNAMSLFTGLLKSKESKKGGVKGVVWGASYRTTPWEHWMLNTKISASAASVLGAKYQVFLQPTMGVDTQYNFSGKDKKIFEVLQKAREGSLLKDTEEFYLNARKMCAQENHCNDISRLFSNKTNLYRDARHPNAEGYRLIAEEIAKILMQKGLVSQK